jgi:hypothetical protein
MHWKLVPLLLSAGLATAAAAGADPASDTALRCVETAATDADRAACIGRGAEACLAAVANPQEMDAAICLNAETAWWQGRLRSALERMQARAAERDAPFAAEIAKGAPRMTDDLANLQAAWKAWSEQHCIFETMFHRGKPDRTRFGATCLLRVTAEQALYLEAAARRD